MSKQVIIIGSGASIRQGLWDTPIEFLPIWKAIQNQFSIAINWSYKWCIPTVSLFVDYKFYMTEREGLSNLPLLVSRKDSFYSDSNRYFKYCDSIPNNLFFLNPSKNENIGGLGMKPVYHGKDAWTKGFYCSQLSGLWALNLAIALECDEIFLLGYDGVEIDSYTHFYHPEGIGKINWEGRKLTGVGKDEKGRYNTGTYNHDINLWFLPFEKELETTKIFNVSPESKISLFPKISLITI